MSALRSVREPVAPKDEAAGFVVSARLAPALAQVRAWAGDSLEALVLSGSHANGDGVWFTAADGRSLSLSDLDVWAVLREEGDVRAASTRAAMGREGAREALAGLGLVAPLETGFVTRAGLAKMPAKPGTIELRRAGRVVAGAAGILAEIPDHGAADVSAEERTLLLENRGFELLLAWPGLAHRDEVARALARHAVLKVAVDLATVAALVERELPQGRGARIAWGLAHLPASPAAPSRFGSTPASISTLWASAAAFAADPQVLETGPARHEWLSCVRAWADTWWRLVAAGSEHDDIWRAVERIARRAPWRRRWRQAIEFEPRVGTGPSRGERLRVALAGTPRHRVHGGGTALLLAAAETGESPGLPSGALRTLRALHVLDGPAEKDWESARRGVTCVWDRWFHDGLRTEERP